MVGVRFIYGLRGHGEIRTRGERHAMEFVGLEERLGVIEAARNIELIDGRLRIQLLQQLDLCVADVDLRGLDIRFILDALQVETLHINLRYIARAETAAAHVKQTIVIAQAVLCDFENRLRLQSLNESAAQIEQQIALEIRAL